MWQTVFRTLGVLDEEKALELGLTHHARLYNLIPCFVHPDPDGTGEGLLLEFKWTPLRWVVPLFDWCWALAWAAYHRGDEAFPPQFGVWVGARISERDNFRAVEND